MELLAAFTVSVVILIIFFLYILLGISFIWSYCKGAPFVRSKRNKIETMLELASIKPEETVVDLGSGDGILLKEAAKKGAKAVGVEINPILAQYSKKQLSLKGFSKNCEVICCNAQDYSLEKADVVFLYLFPPIIEKLKEKFIKELKPDARIVSNAFPITGWKPEIEKNKVYLYKISPHSSIGRAVAS